LDPIDTWLAQVFAPPRLTDTLHRLADASTDDHTQDLESEAARRSLPECNQRLARYRAALEAGTDPTLIARWTAEVNAQRAMAEHRLLQATGTTRMTPTEIHNLVAAIGNLVAVLRTADPADKAAVYRHLGLKLTYKQEAHIVQVHAQPDLTDMGFSSCPRGDLNRPPHLPDLQRYQYATGEWSQYCPGVLLATLICDHCDPMGSGHGIGRAGKHL
jgi:site-specific DNA recombinase